MSLSQAAEPYAKALLSGTDEDLKRRDSFLSELLVLLNQLSDFSSFLKHPEIALEAKKKALERFLADRSIVSLLLLLLKKRRFSLFPLIVHKYHSLLLKKLGIEEAVLTTATPIEPSTLEKLKKRLEESYQKPFSLHSEVDPHLLGGALLTVGNQIVDFSFKGRLQQLKHALTRNV